MSSHTRRRGRHVVRPSRRLPTERPTAVPSGGRADAPHRDAGPSESYATRARGVSSRRSPHNGVGGVHLDGRPLPARDRARTPGDDAGRLGRGARVAAPWLPGRGRRRRCLRRGRLQRRARRCRRRLAARRVPDAGPQPPLPRRRPPALSTTCERARLAASKSGTGAGASRTSTTASSARLRGSGSGSTRARRRPGRRWPRSSRARRPSALRSPSPTTTAGGRCSSSGSPSPIRQALADLGVELERVGSTAVRGSPPSRSSTSMSSSLRRHVPAAIECLRLLGYVYQGDKGLPAEQRGLPVAGAPPHHLYVVVATQ